MPSISFCAKTQTLYFDQNFWPVGPRGIFKQNLVEFLFSRKRFLHLFPKLLNMLYTSFHVKTSVFLVLLHLIWWFFLLLASTYINIQWYEGEQRNILAICLKFSKEINKKYTRNLKNNEFWKVYSYPRMSYKTQQTRNIFSFLCVWCLYGIWSFWTMSNIYFLLLSKQFLLTGNWLLWKLYWRMLNISIDTPCWIC